MISGAVGQERIMGIENGTVWEHPCEWLVFLDFCGDIRECFHSCP